MDYEDVFRIFQSRGVAYLVAGGIAVNLHGVPRFTKDLDILVDTSAANLRRLWGTLGVLGYRPRVPVPLKEFLETKNWKKWKREKGMRAFTLFSAKKPFEEIDILTDTPVAFSQAKKRRVILQVGALRIHLVSIDDLIRMKKAAGRDKDLADIDGLRKAKKIKKKRTGR